MRRPQWIAALVLALAVAGGFAWLGRWQLGHAITLEHEHAAESETVRPLSAVTEPGESVTDRSAGMVVSVEGEFVPGDFRVVEQRSNGGRLGAWVTGHLAVEGQGSGPGHLSVAIGWAPSAGEARSAIDGIEADLGSAPITAPGAAPVAAPIAMPIVVEGRYMPSDAAVVPKPDEDPTRLTSMVPAQLINLWAPFDGPAYGGFLVLHPGDPLDDDALAGYGLEAIDSVPPLPVETINWLNLFYAVEWVVFAGFAVFFWYRLTRDAWEKAHELKRLAETPTEGGSRDPDAVH